MSPNVSVRTEHFFQRTCYQKSFPFFLATKNAIVREMMKCAKRFGRLQGWGAAHTLFSQIRTPSQSQSFVQS